MDTSIIVAIITGSATVAAAVVTLIRSRSKPVQNSNFGVSRQHSRGPVRTAYYRSVQHQFLKFGPLTSRIQPMEGGESFVVPTNALFHDPEGTDQVSNNNRP
jgi:hypothetical protein